MGDASTLPCDVLAIHVGNPWAVCTLAAEGVLDGRSAGRIGYCSRYLLRTRRKTGQHGVRLRINGASPGCRRDGTVIITRTRKRAQ